MALSVTATSNQVVLDARTEERILSEVYPLPVS
jgi:hypothetical protein